MCPETRPLGAFFVKRGPSSACIKKPISWVCQTMRELHGVHFPFSKALINKVALMPSHPFSSCAASCWGCPRMWGSILGCSPTWLSFSDLRRRKSVLLPRYCAYTLALVIFHLLYLTCQIEAKVFTLLVFNSY